MRRTVLLIVSVALLTACGPKKMNEEAVAYARSIVFQNARMSTPMQSYTGVISYYLRIDVHNNGDKPVRQLEVVLYFYDAQGKLVNTERATAISERHKPLMPGETRDFKH